jgi:hypothetical protein
MGIIGKELLEKIVKAERDDDWDLTVELLCMAQLNAVKNYVRVVREQSTETAPFPTAFTANIGEI